MVRPDTTMSVQQCARLCNDPKHEHKEAVERICRDFLKTKDIGLILKPYKSKGLECFEGVKYCQNPAKKKRDRRSNLSRIINHFLFYVAPGTPLKESNGGHVSQHPLEGGGNIKY
jgi:hypothetical protein